MAPIHYAMNNGHLSIISFLLQEGSDPNIIPENPILLMTVNEGHRMNAINTALNVFCDPYDLPEITENDPKIVSYYIENNII